MMRINLLTINIFFFSVKNHRKRLKNFKTNLHIKKISPKLIFFTAFLRLIFFTEFEKNKKKSDFCWIISALDF